MLLSPKDFEVHLKRFQLCESLHSNLITQAIQIPPSELCVTYNVKDCNYTKSRLIRKSPAIKPSLFPSETSLLGSKTNYFLVTFLAWLSALWLQESVH